MNPITLALDYSDLSEADNILSKVYKNIGMIKIGMELWGSHGPESLNLGKKYDLPIFLDLKLHDIPNTVSKTVDVIANKHALNFDIRFLSIHTFGGKAMIKNAVEAAKNSSVRIAAVTVLTSLNSLDLSWLGFSDTRENIQTVDRARQAKKLHIDTFICSPQNAKLMRKHLDDGGAAAPFNATIISPGIRLNDVKDDQKRTMGPVEALKAGVNHLVIGRPITMAEDPEQAALMFKNMAESVIG